MLLPSIHGCFYIAIKVRWPENLRCHGVVPHLRDSDQIFLILSFFLNKEKGQ